MRPHCSNASPLERVRVMKSGKALLIIGLLASATMLLPDVADARRGGGAGFRAGHVHAGGMRPGYHGAGTRWAGGLRPGYRGAAGGQYYRGGYSGGGWGWPAAGVAAGAAIGAAAAYGSSCYQTQNVWNGYTYVPQTVRVC
jgi:hypothetical protein